MKKYLSTAAISLLVILPLSGCKRDATLDDINNSAFVFGGNVKETVILKFSNDSTYEEISNDTVPLTITSGTWSLVEGKLSLERTGDSESYDAKISGSELELTNKVGTGGEYVGKKALKLTSEELVNDYIDSACTSCTVSLGSDGTGQSGFSPLLSFTWLVSRFGSLDFDHSDSSDSEYFVINHDVNEGVFDYIALQEPFGESATLIEGQLDIKDGDGLDGTWLKSCGLANPDDFFVLFDIVTTTIDEMTFSTSFENYTDPSCTVPFEYAPNPITSGTIVVGKATLVDGGNEAVEIDSYTEKFNGEDVDVIEYSVYRVSGNSLLFGQSTEENDGSSVDNRHSQMANTRVFVRQ